MRRPDPIKFLPSTRTAAHRSVPAALAPIKAGEDLARDFLDRLREDPEAIFCLERDETTLKRLMTMAETMSPPLDMPKFSGAHATPPSERQIFGRVSGGVLPQNMGRRVIDATDRHAGRSRLDGGQLFGNLEQLPVVVLSSKRGEPAKNAIPFSKEWSGVKIAKKWGNRRDGGAAPQQHRRLSDRSFDRLALGDRFRRARRQFSAQLRHRPEWEVALTLLVNEGREAWNAEEDDD
jgi:hypothetical protein